MTDLVEWLTAQLDQDEQVARGASPGPWVVLPREAWETVGGYVVEASPNATGYRHKVAAPGYNGGGVWEAVDATHIALHDPARVLRQVAAARRVLARHRPRPYGSHDSYLECSVCLDPDGGCHTWQEHTPLDWPCPDVRDLASIYADRPGFDPTWRTDG